jgi:ATP-dependent Lon protease
MKTIQEELGFFARRRNDEMLLKSKSKKWDEKPKNISKKELSKNARMNPQAPDFGIQRNYLELF